MLFVRLFCVCFVNPESIVRLVVRMFRRMLFVARESFVNFLTNFLMNFMRGGSNARFVHRRSSRRLMMFDGRRLASRILRKRLARKRLEARSE